MLKIYHYNIYIFFKHDLMKCIVWLNQVHVFKAIKYKKLTLYMKPEMDGVTVLGVLI